jgi:hypothetical protein
MKIVVIFKSNTDYALYINGHLIEGFSGSFIPFEYDRIKIGCGLTDGNDTGQRQSFKQLLMWNRELTENEAIDITSYNSYSDLAKGGNFKLV